jgi:CRP-like cAMP-binding protein
VSTFPSQSFDDGALIFSAGDVASHLYFIQSGTVEMLNAQGVVFAEVAQGQTFGEAAILQGGIRSASVRAKGAVTCTLMGAQEACELLETYSPLLVTIVEALLLQQSMQNTMRYG